MCPWPADEIDAIGTKRYEATSGGEREIQRTMLELLNQLDGFDSMGDVKVVLLPASCCCRLKSKCLLSACCFASSRAILIEVGAASRVCSSAPGK